MEDFDRILEIMVKLEREAAELMLHAKHILSENKDDSRNVVTQYDKQVQELLMERLSAAVPGAKFYCEEEMQRDDLKAEHIFIIDPIDGTMNFVRGFNHSCISIACSSMGEIKAAAVYNPYTDEMFTAIKGKGAFLNGKQIHVSENPLSDSLVCCGTSPYNTALKDMTFDMMKNAFTASLDIRRQGSATLDLCSVAAGRAGVYFELSTYLWDYAAGALLVTEAGGALTDINGDPMPFDGGRSSIVAGFKATADEFLELV